MMIRAGDIVSVNLDPTVGGEKGKTRPCVVVVGSGHPWNIIIVVPITEDKPNRTELFVPIAADETSGLSKPSCVDCFQIRCLSQNRVLSKIGIVPSEKTLNAILSKMAAILNIGEEHI